MTCGNMGNKKLFTERRQRDCQIQRGVEDYNLMLMYLERPEGARHQRGGSPVGRRTSSPVTPHIWGDGVRFKMDHLFISNVMVILFIHGASRNMIILIQS